MAKSSGYPSSTEVEKHVKKHQFLPVYFFFGEDTFQIDHSISLLDTALSQEIDPTINRMVFHSKNTPEEMLTEISAFPFLGDKKLVIVKEFEKLREEVKNQFTPLFDNPVETTVLLISCNEQITSTRGGYIKTLAAKGYMFECKPLRSDSLEEWILQYAATRGKLIKNDDARYILAICGDDRAILKMIIEKIILFIGDREQITTEDISAQAIKTKQYNIFDFDRSIEQGDAKAGLTAALALLRQGESAVALIGYLTSYFIKLSRVSEFVERNIPLEEASRLLGTPSWLVSKQMQVRKRFTYARLMTIAEALLEADIEVKTSKFDEDTIMTKLITIIFKGQ